jgi:hypothetical protein
MPGEQGGNLMATSSDRFAGGVCMSPEMATGLFTLGGVLFGGGIGLLKDRVQSSREGKDRLRNERRASYERFLSMALLTLEEAVLVSGDKDRRLRVRWLVPLLPPVSGDRLRDLGLVQLGTAAAALQLHGSQEVFAAAKPMLKLVRDAIRVATDEIRNPGFFEDAGRQWRRLRAGFISAARADLSIEPAEWPDDDD